MTGTYGGLPPVLRLLLRGLPQLLATGSLVVYLYDLQLNALVGLGALKAAAYRLNDSVYQSLPWRGVVWGVPREVAVGYEFLGGRKTTVTRKTKPMDIVDVLVLIQEADTLTDL